MILYTYILISLHFLSIFMSDEPKVNFLGLLLNMPLYLRVLGYV